MDFIITMPRQDVCTQGDLTMFKVTHDFNVHDSLNSWRGWTSTSKPPKQTDLHIKTKLPKELYNRSSLWRMNPGEWRSRGGRQRNSLFPSCLWCQLWGRQDSVDSVSSSVSCSVKPNLMSWNQNPQTVFHISKLEVDRTERVPARAYFNENCWVSSAPILL